MAAYIGHRTFVLAAALLGSAMALQAQPAAKTKTRNVIFVMADGLRWQEVFGGADHVLLERLKEDQAKELTKLYWRETPEARRKVLMPFFWEVLAKQGQVYGNRNAGSEAYVTNDFRFSYPGYSETLCGFADPRVNSNDKVPNPNVTVLEWLHRKAEYRSRVAAFGAWDAFPAILNAERAGFPVVAGFDPLKKPPLTPRIELLNQLKSATTRNWAGEPLDSIPFFTAVEYLKVHKPRVLYLSLGEPDEWAHAGDYPHYLEAVHNFDSYLKFLWDLVESAPEYRGKTSLIVACDHGRGTGPEDWKSHGQEVRESKDIWMAFLGPDTPPLGERHHVAPVTQSQIAATLAALLGEDYVSAVPKAGKPITEALAPVRAAKQ